MASRSWLRAGMRIAKANLHSRFPKVRLAKFRANFLPTAFGSFGILASVYASFAMATEQQMKGDPKIVGDAVRLARNAPERLSSKHVEHVLLDLLALFGGEDAGPAVTEREAWPLVRVLVAYEKWLLPVVGNGLMLFPQQEGAAPDVLAVCSDETYFDPIRKMNDPAPTAMKVSGFGLFHKTFLENCSAVAFNPRNDGPYLVEGNSDAALALFTRVANAVVLEKHLLAGPSISSRSANGEPQAITFLNVIHNILDASAAAVTGNELPMFPMPSPDMSVFVEFPFEPKAGTVAAWTGIDRIEPWPIDSGSLAEISLIELCAAAKNEKLKISWNPVRS